MKTLNINNKNQSKRNTARVFVLFLLLVLSSMRVFGQESNLKDATTVVVKLEVCVESQKSISSVESQIDFMGWFMGSKYNQNTSEFSSENATKTSSPKKQILSSGIEPNRVLYRTFVKKVMNKDNAIA